MRADQRRDVRRLVMHRHDDRDQRCVGVEVRVWSGMMGSMFMVSFSRFIKAYLWLKFVQKKIFGSVTAGLD